MKQDMNNREVSMEVTSFISDLMASTPCNLQDENEVLLHEFFVLSVLTGAVAKAQEKLQEKLKKDYKDGKYKPLVQTKHYALSFVEGTARTSFNKDAFIEHVSKELKIPKHKLLTLADADEAKKVSAPPITVSIIMDGGQ